MQAYTVKITGSRLDQIGSRRITIEMVDVLELPLNISIVEVSWCSSSAVHGPVGPILVHLVLLITPRGTMTPFGG